MVAADAVRACIETTWSVDLANLAAAFARISKREPGPGQVESASWACIRRGSEISALELEAAAAVVNSTSRRWGRSSTSTTSFLCPTAPAPAPSTGVPDQDDGRFDTAATWIEEVFGRIPFTPLANLTRATVDQPATGAVGGRHAARRDAHCADASRGPAAARLRCPRGGGALARPHAGRSRRRSGRLTGLDVRDTLAAHGHFAPPRTAELVARSHRSTCEVARP